jgi:hypothetical protein
LNTTVLKTLLVFLLAGVSVVFFNCQTTRKLARSAEPFHYSATTPETFGFFPPLVTESTIFYDNRYTDQNYHSIDVKRTEDAFFRDMKYVIRDKKLAWVELNDSLAASFHRAFYLFRAPIDSLPTPVRDNLIHAKISHVFIVYDVRLVHTQLIGTTGVADSTHNGSYGPGIHRKLSFNCSIVNVAKNKSVYFKEINKEENGTSLDLVEKSIGMLFHELLFP